MSKYGYTDDYMPGMNCSTQKEMAFCACICLDNFIIEIIDAFQIYSHARMVCMEIVRMKDWIDDI